MIPDRISNLRRRVDESLESWTERYNAKAQEVEARRAEKEAKDQADRAEKARLRTIESTRRLRIRDEKELRLRIDKALGGRKPESLALLKEKGGLDQDALELLAMPARVRAPEDRPVNGRTDPVDVVDHGLGWVRFAMTEWVESTWSRKVSEASCNLDCVRCPSAQALNCAAQNLTAAQKDGFQLPVKDI